VDGQDPHGMVRTRCRFQLRASTRVTGGTSLGGSCYLGLADIHTGGGPDLVMLCTALLAVLLAVLPLLAAADRVVPTVSTTGAVRSAGIPTLFVFFSKYGDVGYTLRLECSRHDGPQRGAPTDATCAPRSNTRQHVSFMK